MLLKGKLSDNANYFLIKANKIYYIFNKINKPVINNFFPFI
jgi:hypothetical protein